MNCRIVRPGTAISMALWLIMAMSWALPDFTEARRVRNNTRTNVNRNLNQNRNVNRNVNVNQNRNVNRNLNVHRDIDIDVDHDYRDSHPVATAVAVTAAVVGAIMYSLPPACSAGVVNGLTYQSCGGTWYQPQYVGTQVSYVVLTPHDKDAGPWGWPLDGGHRDLLRRLSVTVCSQAWG
jgi:hypothetical protein